MITYSTDKLQKVLLSGECEQNGIPTPDNPVDIVCNNGMLKVSPNLFNKNLILNENKYISRGTGALNTPTDGEFRSSDYIVIKENTQYYVGITNSKATTAGLAFYDDTTTYISGISLTILGNDNNIITSPADAKYIRFSFRIDEGYNTNWQNTVYFVEGNEPLVPFIPYGAVYTDGTQEVVTDNLGNTANAERLLAVGDYKDTQEVISGSVTRNVGIKVLDGTEQWNAQAAPATVCRYSADITPDVANNITNSIVFSTHFKCQYTNSTGAFYFSATKALQICVDTSIDTVEKFKQWLADQYAAGTPVIIVYPLVTPTTKTVTPQPLAGSSVTVTAGSINNLPIEISTISELKKRYIGDKEVKKVYIGENIVYNRND